MLRRAEAFLARTPDYPHERFRGRGIVIAGGGDRYFASLYVTIRALRHVGCDLPIQIWYLGRNQEMPAERQALLDPYNVKCVDADEVRRSHPARRLNGWELKVFAVLHCSFQEILFLDADCYPCRDPGFLFDLEDFSRLGAIFWPDMATFDERLKWPAFGVADPRRPGSVESGQFVLDKEQCWRPLNLAWFYNDHSDYYYRYCYGDKHTFEVAWARCGQPFVMWQPQARWSHVAYLHPGPDDAPLFVHRCADKFRFEQHAYLTRQNYAGPTFQPDLPLEKECWGWLAELSPPIGPAFEPPRTRSAARHEPLTELSVHLALARPGTIVDVGAHAGAFTHPLAQLRNTRVLAFEPLADVCLQLRRGLTMRHGGVFPAHVELHAVALGESAGRAQLSVPRVRGGDVKEWASIAKNFEDIRSQHPRGFDGISRREVEVATLDSFERTDVASIKIDVEGHELAVLKGAKNTIARCRPFITMELEERHAPGCTWAVPAYLDALDYNGYFLLAGSWHAMAALDRDKMQRASKSPAVNEYSDPYIHEFYFVPRENASLRRRFLALNTSPSKRQ
jgi:FkbM family methyltransferase